MHITDRWCLGRTNAGATAALVGRRGERVLHGLVALLSGHGLRGQNTNTTQQRHGRRRLGSQHRGSWLVARKARLNTKSEGKVWALLQKVSLNELALVAEILCYKKLLGSLE